MVRHGYPELPEGKRLCVGRRDLPLSAEGRKQARRLGDYFAGLPLRVVSSPLLRCIETAEAISGDYGISEGLLELDMGRWTGLSFDDIRLRWPRLYEQRGREPETTAPPEGESLEDCARRVEGTFWKLLETCRDGTLVLSAHSGVIRALYAALTGSGVRELAAPECGSVTQLLVDGHEVHAGVYGALPEKLPGPIPDNNECEELLRRFGTPAQVRAHCRAVAELAVEICRRLNRRGETLSVPLAEAGALLHDIARTEPRHDRCGACWLNETGYAAVAAVVGNHMSLGAEKTELAGGGQIRWSESAAVFLADKLVSGTSRVSLEERFFARPDPRKLPFIHERYGLARSLLLALEEETVDGNNI